MNKFLTLNEFAIIVFSLAAIGSIGVIFYSIYDTFQKSKREDFGLLLIRLIDEAKEKAQRAWDNQGVYRFLVPRINDLLERIKETGKGNNYLSYLILSKLPDNEYKRFEAYHLKGKKLDLTGNLSVERFLQGIIKRADDFLNRKQEAQATYKKVDDFSGPHEIFLKIEDGYIHFLLFDELINCISFQIIYPLHDFLENKEKKEKISKTTISNLGYSFDFEGEKFVAHVNTGTVDYRFSCEYNSFDEALNKRLTAYFTKIQYHQ